MAANVMRSANKIRTGLTANEIKQAFRDNLMRSSILNTARMGGFSSARSIRDTANGSGTSNLHHTD
jgi:hypothetical protein